MTYPLELLGVDELDDSTQPFTKQQIDAAREAVLEAKREREVDLSVFASFGERGTPPDMIASDNAASLLVVGSCGPDEAVPVVRSDHRSSRTPRADRGAQAQFEERMTRQMPAVGEFEERMTRQMPAVGEFEQRMTRQMPALPGSADAEFEERMTRQMPAIPADDDDAEFEEQQTREMPAMPKVDDFGTASWGPQGQGPLAGDERSAAPPTHASAILDSSPEWTPQLRAEVAERTALREPPSEPQEVPPPLSRRRAWLPIVVGALALLALLGGLAMVVARPDATPEVATPTEPDEVSEAREADAAPTPSLEPSTDPEPELVEAEPASTLEVLDEVEPEPTPSSDASGGSSGRRNAKPHTTSECAAIRAKTERAHRAGDWKGVEVLTRKRKCWSSATAANQRRIRALFELGRFDDCQKLGAGSTDSTIKKMRTLCEAARP